MGATHLDWYRRVEILIFPTGAIFWRRSLFLFNRRTESEGWKSTLPGEENRWDISHHTRRLGAWLQDSYTRGRLTLHGGLRWDFSRLKAAEAGHSELRYSRPGPLQNPALEKNALLESLIQQWHENIGPVSPWDEQSIPSISLVRWTTLSPRLGVVYDLFGTGQTVLKFSFSRLYEPVLIDPFRAGGIFDFRTVNYAWTDSNANGLMDLPDTDSYVLTSLKHPGINETAFVEDLSSPWTNEWMAGIEQEIFHELQLGFRFLYRSNKNLIETIDVQNGFDPDAMDDKGSIWIPFTIQDPGWDGLFNTQDDQDITVYGLRQDRPVPLLKGANPSKARRQYLALLFTLDKRMATIGSSMLLFYSVDRQVMSEPGIHPEEPDKHIRKPQRSSLFLGSSRL